jgi:hypothetical protein
MNRTLSRASCVVVLIGAVASTATAATGDSATGVDADTVGDVEESPGDELDLAQAGYGAGGLIAVAGGGLGTLAAATSLSTALALALEGAPAPAGVMFLVGSLSGIGALTMAASGGLLLFAAAREHGTARRSSSGPAQRGAFRVALAHAGLALITTVPGAGVAFASLVGITMEAAKFAPSTALAFGVTSATTALTGAALAGGGVALIALALAADPETGGAHVAAPDWFDHGVVGMAAVASGALAVLSVGQSALFLLVRETPALTPGSSALGHDHIRALDEWALVGAVGFGASAAGWTLVSATLTASAFSVPGASDLEE